MSLTALAVWVYTNHHIGAQMKRSIPLLIGLAFLGDSQSAWSVNGCYWNASGPAGPQNFRYDAGSVYVPRHAEIGSVIGQLKKPGSSRDDNLASFTCDSDGSRTLQFAINAVKTISPVILPPINGTDVNGKVIDTNIPGVGAYIELRFPFTGVASNEFDPVGPPIVPFTATHSKRMSVLLTLPYLYYNVTLIKTGDITPGPQLLDGSTLATATGSDVGKVFDFGIAGTIIQAQCSVSANAVSADPVNLGDWDVTDFKGPTSGTTPVPFSINLENCIADPQNNNIATAHIRLDGAKDSTPIDSANGVFSLSADSTAKGIAIQMLSSDGTTPFELEKEIPVVAITPGNIVLDFKARFFQTADMGGVMPGIAKGALGFTITYK